MVKASEDYLKGDISPQLQRLRGFGGIRTVDNVDCSPLQPNVIIKQILSEAIAEMSTSEPGSFYNEGADARVRRTLFY